jgi:hypothetical protein
MTYSVIDGGKFHGIIFAGVRITTKEGTKKIFSGGD